MLKRNGNIRVLATMVLSLGLLFLGGCAGSKTYLLNLSYSPLGTPQFLPLSAKPVTLALYRFEDVRPDRIYLGRRVYRDGSVDFFKPDAGTVEQVLTQSVIKLMEKAGFKILPVNRVLNKEKEDFKDIPGDVALGGKIEALWVEAKTGYATTDTNARLRIKVVWGLPKERVWMSKAIEGSAQETDRPLYQVKHAEAKINEVFKDGMDKFLKDENQLREKILKQ
ncbi:MAG: hypothetical protein AMJ94_14015 [Deltaproteobacteria bacterium SM23_61]|nr:MAG: hypothetical protein AMJ94_14015 [Deltaproteobacteria bacterium SM23_61]